MGKIIANCPQCKQRMTTSIFRGKLNHFYCHTCKKLYLPDEVESIRIGEFDDEM